jgi:hypothetical protein
VSFSSFFSALAQGRTRLRRASRFPSDQASPSPSPSRLSSCAGSILWAFAAAGCTTTPTTTETATAEFRRVSPFAQSASSASPSSTSSFRCSGPYVPPQDFDDRGHPVSLEYAVAEGPADQEPGMLDEAARHQLVQRLCRLSDPASCAPLHAGVTITSRALEGDRRCAMAILRSSVLEEWRRQLSPDLTADLVATFRPLLLLDDKKERARALGKKGRNQRVVVVLSTIDDRGVPGGLRADWLMGQVRRALTMLDVDTMEPPRGYLGHDLPDDIDFVLRGSLVERVDPKRQLPVLDVSFSLVDRVGGVRTGAPVVVPAAMAPLPPARVHLPPPTAGLALHVETRASGSLCPGDYTQIHVTNESNEPLVVRVFNLDENGEALLLFPNESRTDDLLPPGKTVTLSADGFTVEGAPGSRERYVAVGTPRPEGLGSFRSVRGTCRYRRAAAARLSQGVGFEFAAYRAVTGFTILDDVRCEKPIALPDQALVAAALADVPWCDAP